MKSCGNSITAKFPYIIIRRGGDQTHGSGGNLVLKEMESLRGEHMSQGC